MSFARRHLTFANVAAAIALLLATGGGALAATHYLITSTNQISPRVLSQLHGRRGPVGKTGKTGRRGKEGPRGKPGGPRGRRGPEGPAGPPGLVGVQGIQGLTGGKGPRGEPGAPGASAYSPLPPGQSESGVYAINAGSPAPEKLYEPVTLPVLLGARVPAENVEYVPLKGKGPHCEAQGTAPRGYLCIYSDFPIEPGVLGEPIVVNPEAAESGPEGKGSGLHGFVLEWTPKPLDGAYDYGTYTVTEK